MSEIIVESIENYGLSKKVKPKVQFSKVGIVGCGTEGQNIARMIATKGIDVVFVELSDELVNKSLKSIERELNNQIEHWGMTESEKRIILSRIKGYITYDCLTGCDMIIESILTKNRELSLDISKGIFVKVEQYVSKDAIIATNASTQVITELASELHHKHRCVSLHFITNSPDAKLVEVVRGLYTSDEVYENTRKFLGLIGKQMIEVQESPGLLSVRMFVSIINEACEMLLERVGKLDDIDLTMREGLGLSLGPFEMSDSIGLDKVLRWMDNLYAEFGEIKYKASPLIKRLVRANQLGLKVRIGFYEYDENGIKKPRRDPLV
ncbi:MAG: 3-hydroxyacyl-CoA dehydrogenase family protein [Bacteroidales bacterium]|nr:3-hydroxyacyl-CoA dehydrogenase family protein [Bacteroidales bacterium]